MTEQNKSATPTPPEQKPAEKRPAEKPLRRVGSLTLGFGLMAVGVFFLCYYFVPQFNWELALKIAPAAGLCLLGAAVAASGLAAVGKARYNDRRA